MSVRGKSANRRAQQTQKRAVQKVCLLPDSEKKCPKMPVTKASSGLSSSGVRVSCHFSDSLLSCAGSHLSRLLVLRTAQLSLPFAIPSSFKKPFSSMVMPLANGS